MIATVSTTVWRGVDGIALLPTYTPHFIKAPSIGNTLPQDKVLLHVGTTETTPLSEPPLQTTWHWEGDVSIIGNVLGEIESPPTSSDIDTMLGIIDSHGECRELAQSLATAITQSWESGSASFLSPAVQKLRGWIATAELYSEPGALERLLEAEASIERGDGTSWDTLRAELGL